MNTTSNRNVNRATILTLVAGALMVLAVAATGGIAAADAGEDTPGDGANVTDDGPPSDLPDPVPDFVGDLLGAIDDFLSGLSDAIGTTEVVPGGDRR